MDGTQNNKLDYIVEKLSKFEAEFAAQRAYNEAQKLNIERFWQKDWRELIDRIDKVGSEQVKIEHRLHMIELIVHPMPERVAKLEAKMESQDKRNGSVAIGLISIGIIASVSAGTRIAQLTGLVG